MNDVGVTLVRLGSVEEAADPSQLPECIDALELHRFETELQVSVQGPNDVGGGHRIQRTRGTQVEAESTRTRKLIEPLDAIGSRDILNLGQRGTGCAKRGIDGGLLRSVIAEPDAADHGR